MPDRDRHLSRPVPPSKATTPAQDRPKAGSCPSGGSDGDAGARGQGNLTVLGFDYGSKRIGAAVGNSITRTATPLRTLRADRNDLKFDAIAALIREWQPQQLVVGLPLYPDGAEHDTTRLAQRFARQLQGRFGLPVALVDERYTSAVAEDAGADDLDTAAAQLIVEQYLQHLQP
ncbi:putative holliday junction resolvase [mine drainage metagenome]|uniref:Putative holliday junction resolvase n=1 Tax=mine drainage metagenome TaxID=410659 RepID=A0A1J5Q4N0_9ZZZZ